MLCQSLMPHEMLVILNKNEGLLVKITSTIEGGAFLVKHVGLVIRLVKSKMSQTDCNGLHFWGILKSGLLHLETLCSMLYSSAARGKVRSSTRTSFPLLSHRLLHFVHGRHRLLDHPILCRALTPRQLSVACTLLVPANIRATTRWYRKAHRTQFTLRHATVRQLCYPNASNPRLHFLFGAIFFQRGLRHLICREYGKQRAHPKNAGDYPMRIHHPWHVTVVT